MRANHLHANTMAPVPVHLKSREEKEAHTHCRARRVSSDENSRTKVGGPECHISTIPELAECLEKRLRFNNQKGDADSICLICHEELRNGRSGIQELHCGHHFHKECFEKWLWQKQSCPTCRVHVTMPEPLYWSSARVQFP
ncbi:uncharacterized protein [Garra rufa]|uniref:uncharacterized protein isoform X2 n=1 Tax=Garra rufa TaxID=137080 RepID=UPI003CCE9357